MAGIIDLHGLRDWWMTAFTEAERQHIIQVHGEGGLGGSLLGLDSGDHRGIQTTQSPGQFLWCLAGWFLGPDNRDIARKIIEKAEKVCLASSDILDLHFTYGTMIKVYYPDREVDPTAFRRAVYACEQQIAIANQAAQAFRREYKEQPPPAHAGFTQLAIIREKEKNYVEALRLSREARQQRWGGDWEKRIARYEQRLAKQQK
jgi:hypothetical protein